MIYYGPKELAASFRTVRKNTIAIAEDIPEAQYTFRPTPESRSVADILRHITTVTRGYHEAHAVNRIQTYIGVDFAAQQRKRQELETRLQTKAQIIEALRRDGDAWASFLDTVTEGDLAHVLAFPEPAEPRTKSRFELCLSLKEHEMHHRAQLMVVERLLGIVPHLTRERQARMAQAAPPKPAGA
jgi:uncharacterized damage-inducible protein DinB